MREFVLDCSATLPWVFAAEATSETEALLNALAGGAKARVPALWHLELANVLLGAKRQTPPGSDLPENPVSYR